MKSVGAKCPPPGVEVWKGVPSSSFDKRILDLSTACPAVLEEKPVPRSLHRSVWFHDVGVPVHFTSDDPQHPNVTYEQH
ncbi:hypothetical protein AVEN_55500-1 [Araneus ventricosus]|uniref:Uncharacterized protein n=1 Tax=Araneus ventricosus TaxID=182803 RepID=A0A4Y2CAC0_ARAVE|nr:hypothetical protein AVEN_55500-1 [Araneus ventricosus]